MTDRPEDRSGERRRTGPLGDDQETRHEEPRREEAGQEETRREEPRREESRQEETRREEPGQEDEGATRQISPEEARRSRSDAEGERRETRVIRTPGGRDRGQDSGTYPRGYFEAAEEREDRLHDLYGGVDWLASFLGFVFTLVVGSVLFGIAGLILVPLGFSPDLSGGQLTPGTITGLVVIAVLVFLTFFFGGYVAGRMARFDGGRNGAMLIAWSILILVLVFVVGGFLPAQPLESLRSFISEEIIPTVGGLAAAGIIGIGVLVGAALVALLGGILGGRLGSRYHAEIDRTT
jgi:hypothetical protein